MTSSNETLKHIIRDYNPKKQEMLCKIDLIKLSQMEALKNPTPDKKDVYEAFFDYAEKLKENHPAWDSESYIKARFGSAYEKMAEIAPEAYQKYEQKLHPQEISQKKNYIKPETTISYN